MFVIIIAAATGCKKNSSPAAATTATAAPTCAYSELASVPDGTYIQEDALGNSFSSTVSAFKIGRYEVTYDLWYTVYQWAIANGYTFANAGLEGVTGTAGAAPTVKKYQPVTKINWRDAIVWCNAYSQKEALTPVYCSDAGFTTAIKSSADVSYAGSVNTAAGSFDNPYVNWSAGGYRLPTESEWQYAAEYKDGTNWTPYNYASGATGSYNGTIESGLVAWYSANAGYSTQSVGGKEANELGIYDMSGNVWEMCWDWYDSYPAQAVVNYRGASSGNGRVIRGGCFSGSTFLLQTGLRSYYNPYDISNDRGFRLVRAE